MKTFEICTNCVKGVVRSERSLDLCPVCNGTSKIPIYNFTVNLDPTVFELNSTPVDDNIPEPVVETVEDELISHEPIKPVKRNLKPSADSNIVNPSE